MAVTCALGMGGLAASTASAAPAHHVPSSHCPRKGHGHYPPGKCRIFFNKGTYRPGQHVKFESGEVFRSHEKVSVTLTCHKGKYQHHYSAVTAGSHGRAKGSIKLSKHLKNWGCTLSLKGKKSGIVLNGHFSVRK
jgi:hypothetical protein